jgi:hypothetical protein
MRNKNNMLLWTGVGVVTLFASYAGLVVFATWPISSWSIDKAGTFGDSFGVLTSLFTGLAFVGLLSTIHLQREDLLLNRQELEATRNEFKLQSDTFHRQRFEDAFYQMLSLYKDNLRELSVRPQADNTARIRGIDALHYLNTKFDKAWAKHKLKEFPTDELLINEVLYMLVATIQSVYVRQTRYVETLTNILILVEEECTPLERKPVYWRIISSQLTAHELKYLFFQALVSPDFTVLRDFLQKSAALQDRIGMLGLHNMHRKSFELIWGITLPKQRAPFRSPLTSSQIKQARKAIQAKKGGQVVTIAKDEVQKLQMS